MRFAVYKLIFSLIAALSLPSCGKPPRPRPNVILIVADTLRPDHLGCYGYPEKVTPDLDNFAEDCVIFNRAYAPVPSTLPSHVSIFTGLYPDVHRVIGSKDGALSPEINTIAQKLKDLGYANVGAVSSLWLKESFGLARGFDDYREIEDDLTAAPQVNAAAFELLERLAETPDRRFFLFLHYYDPHSDFSRFRKNKLPYYAPGPFLDRFGRGLNDLLAVQDELNSYATDYLVAANEKKIETSPLITDAVVSLYDAGLAYFDQQLGSLLEKLKEKGFYDDSLIIFTADHGEEFREHGEFLHNQPYEESILVPLLVKFPDQEFKGKRVRTPVELIDITPFLLDYLNIPVDKYVQGESFLPIVEKGKERSKEILSRQKSLDRAHIYSLTEGRYKLLYDLKTGRRELYNLEADPGEKTNLAAKEPKLASRLEKKLKEKVRANAALAATFKKAGEKSVLSSKEIEKLKALGYLAD